MRRVVSRHEGACWTTLALGWLALSSSSCSCETYDETIMQPSATEMSVRDGMACDRENVQSWMSQKMMNKIVVAVLELSADSVALSRQALIMASFVEPLTQLSKEDWSDVSQSL
jgi:hypothetical protein